MSELGDLQKVFSKLIAEHTLWLYHQGYECSEGDAYRDPRSHGVWGERIAYGRKYSAHKLRLAKDINLFKDGVLLEETVDHKLSGQKWETRHSLCRWGGRYDDGNHYSMEYKGRQ